MITIFSFIPKNYIKYDKNDKPSISLFSSIKTSILNQTYADWELLLVTNVENVMMLNESGENKNNNDNNNINVKENDPRIKIVYTSDSYFNLNTLFKINNNDDNGSGNSYVINSQSKYVSFFDIEHDIWNINKLQIQYNLMTSSDYDVIGCESTHSTQSISAVVPRVIKKIELSLFTACPFLFSTVLMKRDLFKHYDDIVLKNEYDFMNNNNFSKINSESNTIMSQFHALLLYLTLIERNIYCICYSNSTSKNSLNLNSNSLYIERIFNHCLVETSLESKLIFLQERKSCDHVCFINAKQYFEERFIRIRFFSDFCSSENCKQEY